MRQHGPDGLLAGYHLWVSDCDRGVGVVLLGCTRYPVELFLQRGLAVAHHKHLLLLELLRDVARGGAGNLDPSLGEESAGNQYK